jgi:hypothetical protein
MLKVSGFAKRGQWYPGTGEGPVGRNATWPQIHLNIAVNWNRLDADRTPLSHRQIRRIFALGTAGAKRVPSCSGRFRDFAASGRRRQSALPDGHIFHDSIRHRRRQSRRNHPRLPRRVPGATYDLEINHADGGQRRFPGANATGLTQSDQIAAAVVVKNAAFVAISGFRIYGSNNDIAECGVVVASKNNNVQLNEITQSADASVLVQGNNNKVVSNEFLAAEIGIWIAPGSIGTNHFGSQFFATVTGVFDQSSAAASAMQPASNLSSANVTAAAGTAGGGAKRHVSPSR